MMRGMNLRAIALTPVLVLVLALGACGDSGGDSTTTTGSAGSTSTGQTSSAEAKQKCLDAASGISDASAKSVAEKGCNALADNPEISEALVQAKEKCLEAAGKLPVASLQTTAVEACNKISK